MCWCYNVSKLRIVYGSYSVSKLPIFFMGVNVIEARISSVEVTVSVSRDLRLVGVIVSVSCESLLLRVRTSVKYELRVVGS